MSSPFASKGGTERLNMNQRIIPEPFLSNSRKLRKEQTPWEAKLWYYLRAGRFYGIKFKRQVQIGRFIYDFSSRDKMLIIELDGGQHTEIAVSEKDQIKQKYAESENYTVLRFWNNELDNNITGVLEIIKKACKI